MTYTRDCKDAFTLNNYELGIFMGQILQIQIVRMKKDEVIFPMTHKQVSSGTQIQI